MMFETIQTVKNLNDVSFVLQSRIVNSLRVVHVIQINKGFFSQEKKIYYLVRGCFGDLVPGFDLESYPSVGCIRELSL